MHRYFVTLIVMGWTLCPLTLAPHLSAADSETTIKILNYNVFNGFRRNASFETAVKWINEQSPDIAGWQELVGWDEDRLKTAAKKWNHPYVATLKGGGYNIGLSSRQPIEVLQRRTANFWHGYLHCRTAGLDVIVCHLWPGSRREQIKEATLLYELVVRLDQQGREIILMGDFNAHSRSDQSWIDQQQPLIDRRWTGNKNKILTDRFIVDGKWNFDVMNKIMQAPLQDVVRDKFDLQHPQPSDNSLLDLGSYPTRVLAHVNTPEKQQGFLERIDFILASPDLAKRCQSAEIVRDDERVETISDHYPVMAVFKVNKPD